MNDGANTPAGVAGRAPSVESREPAWVRLLRHPLLHLVVGFLLTWLVGTVLTGYWKDKQLRNDRALENDRLRAAANFQSIQQLSELMYERRTRAEMLASALRRNWPLEEVRTRKAAYDSAYVRWNRGIMQTYLTIRGIVDEKDYSSIEAHVQTGLVPHLSRWDSALTAAYTVRLARPLTAGDLDGTLVRTENQAVINCAYEITHALWVAVSSRGSTDPRWIRIADSSRITLAERCPMRSAPDEPTLPEGSTTSSLRRGQ